MKRWRLMTLTAVLVAAAAPLRAQERTKEREREEARAKAAAEARAAARAQARARAEVRRRGWLGISFSTRDGSRWAVIDDVFPGSPAAKAGLQEGDTLVTWNGSSDVASSVGRRPLQPGESVKLRVRRGGRDRDVTVVAGERPERARIATRDGDDIVIRLPDDGQWRILADSLALRADSLQRQLRVMLRDSLGPQLKVLRERDLADLRIAARELSRELGPGGMVFGLNRGVAGAEFAELNPDLSDYFGAERGVVVLKVADEGPAERAGLRAGDVVVRADGQPVGGLADLRRQVLRAQDRDRRSVELEVLRKGKHRTLSLEW